MDCDGGLHEGFDSIAHKSIWKALKACDIKHDSISLLKKIYRDQKASVQTDEESNIFDIQKGSKQGDPMSSLLFNTVLQYALKNVIQRWQTKKGMGATNLRFADDVMLFATSKEQIPIMMYEFRKATEKVGLRIHPDKRMIQSTQRKMRRLIIQTKRKYKKIEKQDIEPKEEKGIVEKTENWSTDEESGDGQSTKSEDDVDSGVTFDEDSEKELDTNEIKEEDWIDYIKRSTADALGDGTC